MTLPRPLILSKRDWQKSPVQLEDVPLSTKSANSNSFSLTPVLTKQRRDEASLLHKTENHLSAMNSIIEEPLAALIDLTMEEQNTIEKIKETPVARAKPPLANGIRNANRIGTKERTLESFDEVQL